LAGSSMTPLQLVALLDALLDRDESDTYRLTRDLRSAVRHPTPDTGELTPAFRQHRLQMLRVLTVEVPDSIQRISILDVEVWGRAETELPRIQACRQPDERRVVDLDLPVVGLTLYLEICLDLVELRHQLL